MRISFYSNSSIKLQGYLCFYKNSISVYPLELKEINELSSSKTNFYSIIGKNLSLATYTSFTSIGKLWAKSSRGNPCWILSTS